MKKFHFAAALLGMLVLAACDKNTVQTIDGPLAGSYVKFFNFGVNAPAVNYYSDNVKITAINNTTCQTAQPDPKCLTTGIESATGISYGNVGNAGLYSAIAPGSHTFAGKSVAPADSGAFVTTVTSSIAQGQYYSLYTSGIYNSTTKSVESFVVQDSFPAIDFTRAYVRFVNAVSNSSPMILYAKDPTSGNEVAVSPAVAYKGASSFVALPPGTYDLNLRAPNSSTNLVTRTGVQFTVARSWTITVRGDMTASSGTNKPALDNTANQ
jgi:hypothetical protein